MHSTNCRALIAIVFGLTFIGSARAQQEQPAGLAPDPVHEHIVGCGKSAAAQAGMEASEMSDDPLAYERYAEALTDTDVLTNDLDIEVVPSNSTITGSNTMVVKSLVNGLTTFTFRLRSNFTITQAQLNGTTNVTPVATGSYGRQITLDHTYNINEQFTLKVVYNGPAVSRGFGSITFGTQNGTTIVSSLSEPYFAATWWPAKDGDFGAPGDNSDKFTMKIAITAPNTLRTVCNGLLTAIDTVAGNKKKYHWETNYPTSTYLICFSTTNYNTYTTTYTYPGGTMPMEINIYPASDTAGNRSSWQNAVNMMAAYRPYFGEYPFVNEKYGIYQFPFSGGMEHQTNTGQGVFNEGVTAHELGHQWWGDNVTCRYWNDIWLNEGFATFSQAIWQQYKTGTTDWPAYFQEMNNNKPSSVGDSVYVYDTTDVNRIFSSTYSYDKGSWVLHMLRHVIGETDFFAALQNYRTAYQGSGATTDNFAATVSSTVGTDMAYFFQQWVYGIGAPAYNYGWQTANINGQNYMRLYVAQTQTASYGKYKMPIDIRVNYNPGLATFVASNDAVASQWFVIPVAAPVSSISFDPNGWILYTAANSVAYVNGPPKIVQTTPTPGAALALASSPTSVTLTFSEPIIASATNFTVNDGTNNIPFTYSYNAGINTATLTFSSALLAGNYSVLANTGIVSSAAGIGLDGEIADPNNPASLPSGNGLTGGNALFKFSISGTACTGDLNNDGFVDLSDLSQLLANYGGTGVGDLDNNGVVDLGDLAIMLSLYGVACP